MTDVMAAGTGDRSSATGTRNDAASNTHDSPTRTRRRQRTKRLLEEAAQAPSVPERSALIDQVIELNLEVARDIARRYQRRGIPDEDLLQVANLALVKAAQGFDPTRGADFLSFAVPTIRGELRRHFRDFGWTVRPPRSVQEAQTRIAVAQGKL